MGNGMNKVLPGLYVGNFRDSKDPEQLKTHNITHILSIHDNARKLPCNSDKEYLCILASDSPGQNLLQYFPACNDFIHTARLKGGAVLIHCLAGMSRSVTVAVVYVMCVTSLSWRDALKAVRGARNVANPNVGFLKQLQDFENERMAEERRRLRSKYPSVTLGEDEQVAKQLLASYYHSLSLGEMCDGNCPPGVTCPRGLCHPSRRVGLFRRNSRESSGSRSSSPSRRSSSPSPSPSSPGSSPVSPRRGCPTSSSPLTRRSGSSSPQLTPPQPSSPHNSRRRSSSPLRSPRHNTSPLASPKRSTSPTSPKRGTSPDPGTSASPAGGRAGGNAPSPGAPRPRQHLTVSGASQTHLQQRHSPQKTVICSVSKNQQSQPVVSRILQERAGKASHKSTGSTFTDIPNTSDKKQEKSFEQFHELFKKCSVKNVGEAASGSQSEWSGRAMTHTQNICTSTGTRPPLPQ